MTKEEKKMFAANFNKYGVAFLFGNDKYGEYVICPRSEGVPFYPNAQLGVCRDYRKETIVHYRTIENSK